MSGGGIEKREADLIWRRIEELAQTTETARTEARENFQILFGKMEEVKQGFGKCDIHRALLDGLSQSLETVKTRQASLPSRFLSNLHYVATVAALLVAGLVWLIKN